MSDRGTWPAAELIGISPCPFCKAEPSVAASYVDTGSGDGAYSYRIRCDRHYPTMTVEAGALGRHGYVREDDPKTEADVRATVKAAWNDRRA